MREMNHQIATAIWNNAKFWFTETHSETCVYIENAEGRTAIFYNGSIAIHTGDKHLFEDKVERAHHISAFMAYVLLNGISMNAGKDFPTDTAVKYYSDNYPTAVDAVLEIAEEILRCADTFSSDERKIAFAVIRRTEASFLNIWKGMTSTNEIFFDLPYGEDALWEITDKLNRWACSCKSIIRFEVIYYDCGGAYPGGFRAYW